MTPEVEKRYVGCPNPLEYVRREVLVWFVRLMPVINVGRVKEIPCDWPGLIGVPISFMDKFDPDQFEVVDSIKPSVDGKDIYQRIVIRNRRPNLPEWCRLSDYGLCFAIARMDGTAAAIPRPASPRDLTGSLNMKGK